jgi:hypothetical protein
MEFFLVLGNPSTMVFLNIMILPTGVESLLILSNPSTMIFLDIMILPLSVESLLIFIDPSTVVFLDILKSHLSFWSLLVDVIGLMVDLGNKSLRTLNNVIFGSPFVSNVRLPSSFMSPVGFIVLVWLLDVDVISSSPSSVLPVEVWKIDAALVWLPYESAVMVGPNESVEPMAVLSVLPDESSLVMPMVTKLRDCSVSGNHAVSEDWSVDPMVAGNSNNSSGLNNPVRSINPMVSGPSSLSGNSVISHHSVGSPNLVVGGPVLQFPDSVGSPNVMWSLDFSGGGPSL